MRTKFPGNQIRLIDLIEELAIAKADAESFHWKCAVFCCKRSDGSGIETTTEEHPQRNIAHQSDANSFIYQFPRFVDGVSVRKGSRCSGGFHRVPVCLQMMCDSAIRRHF